MVQLKGEICYSMRKYIKISKNVDFTGFFKEKNPKKRAKQTPFQI